MRSASKLVTALIAVTLLSPTLSYGQGLVAPLPAPSIWPVDPTTPPVAETAPTPALPAAPAQSFAAAQPTGFFFRAGATATNFNSGGLTFRQSDAPPHTMRAMVPGKDFISSSFLPGMTLGLGIDTNWFYVRVGVDVLSHATAVRPDQDDVHFTSLAWGAVGGRLVLGRLALLAGVRLGAMFVGLSHQSDPTHATAPVQFDAIAGIYAADLGVEWRPFRWLQVDASVGQDFGGLYATTASLAASFGWSRNPSTRP